MSFSVVGRHTLSDIRPRFDMPLQEAAADLGIRCVRFRKDKSLGLRRQPAAQGRVLPRTVCSFGGAAVGLCAV